MLSIIAMLIIILIKAINIFIWIMFARAIISWIMMIYPIRNQLFLNIIYVIHRITNIVLEPIARIIPPIGIIDLSFIVGYLLLVALRYALGETLITVMNYMY